MKYIIALNLKQREFDPNDFFSQEEYEEIDNFAKELSINYEIIVDEINFINQLSCLEDVNSIRVLNLTRQGTFNNKKVLVNAYCDIRSIPCISSPALTVNLARSKFLLPDLFSKEHYIFPKMYSFDDLHDLSTSHQKVILKQKQGAASIDLSEKNVGFIQAVSNTEYRLNDIPLDEDLKNHFFLQEFIDGIEVEVPFIIKRKKIYILGFFQILFKGSTNFITQEISDNYSYGFKKLKNLDEDYITLAIKHIVNKIGIQYYGRIDFRISNVDDHSTYKVFDIATTPYFIKNSSFYHGYIEDAYLCNRYKNILDVILSTLD